MVIIRRCGLMRDRRWVNHFIRKYGKKRAKEFANQNCSCPCILFDWSCRNCGYGTILLEGLIYKACNRSKEYYDIPSIRKQIIKRKLRKRLK